jgi:hypothetical protein
MINTIINNYSKITLNTKRFEDNTYKLPQNS